jgi:iron complex outermembrane receptor protein
MEILESAYSEELGKSPMLIPEESASLWFDYTLSAAALKGLGFGAGARYIGKRWNNQENTSSQPGYTLFDAAVHYATGPWRFGLNATNLFDKEYLASRAYDSYLRGDERNVLFTVKYDF